MLFFEIHERRSHEGILSMPEDIPADHAATDFEELAVNVDIALETKSKATERMLPGARTPNAPAIFAKVAVMIGTVLGDTRSHSRDKSRPRVVYAMGGNAIRESSESLRLAA